MHGKSKRGGKKRVTVETSQSQLYEAQAIQVVRNNRQHHNDTIQFISFDPDVLWIREVCVLLLELV